MAKASLDQPVDGRDIVGSGLGTQLVEVAISVTAIEDDPDAVGDGHQGANRGSS